MSGEQQNKGQIKIFAKNIRGNASGGILEEARYIKNIAGGRHIQNGGNGVNNDVNQPRKEDLRVIKVEGPFDPTTNRKVDIIEKGKKYNFKVTQYNRPPSKDELKNLKWGFKYDDGSIAIAPQVNGLENISYYVSESSNVNKLMVYAYFIKPINSVSVEAYLIKEEIIVIIATEQYYKNPANKLMFGAQAVRLVRTKLSKHPFLKVVIFKEGYTENQLSAMAKAILHYNSKATFMRINTISDIINIINSGSKETSSIDSKRKVKDIYAYSHGYVRTGTNEGVIAFGYTGKNAENQELDFKEFSAIKPEIFLNKNNSKFYSLSCRTGIGTASETAIDPIKNNSLAQKMANHGKITVFAYMRRSQYEDTWGTVKHRNTYASDNDSEDSKWGNFKSDIRDLTSSDPKDMEIFTKYRNKEIKIDGAVWNPEGAYIEVKGGSLPPGVPATFDKYIPN